MILNTISSLLLNSMALEVNLDISYQEIFAAPRSPKTCLPPLRLTCILYFDDTLSVIGIVSMETL